MLIMMKNKKLKTLIVIKDAPDKFFKSGRSRTRPDLHTQIHPAWTGARAGHGEILFYSTLQ